MTKWILSVCTIHVGNADGLDVHDMTELNE